MKINMAFVAERVVVRRDGKLDVTGLGSPTAIVSALPVTMPTFKVALLVAFDAADQGGNLPIQFTVVPPDGKPIWSDQIFTENLYPAHTGRLVEAVIESFELTMEGRYHIVFEADREKNDAVYIEVRLAGASGGAV